MFPRARWWVRKKIGMHVYGGSRKQGVPRGGAHIRPIGLFLNCKGVRSGRVGHVIEATCHVPDLHVSTLDWLMLGSSNPKFFFLIHGQLMAIAQYYNRYNRIIYFSQYEK